MDRTDTCSDGKTFLSCGSRGHFVIMSSRTGKTIAPSAHDYLDDAYEADVVREDCAPSATETYPRRVCPDPSGYDRTAFLSTDDFGQCE